MTGKIKTIIMTASIIAAIVIGFVAGVTVGKQVASKIIIATPTQTIYAGRQCRQIFSASGGLLPYTWSISAGSLPPGLLLDASTGIISGVPTTVGDYQFTIKVTDCLGNTG